MIGKLYGRVDTIEPGWIILMVGGVGYRLLVPGPTASRLAIDEEATLYVYTHVRDDAIHLYGFHDRTQQQVFEMLLSVSGIGPKLALAILSQLTVSQFVQALQAGEVRVLTQVPGVGRKTAERLLLELKDRFKSWETDAPEQGESEGSNPVGADIESDVIEALIQLGYSADKSRSAVTAVLQEESELSLEEALRAALRRLQSL